MDVTEGIPLMSEEELSRSSDLRGEPLLDGRRPSSSEQDNKQESDEAGLQDGEQIEIEEEFDSDWEEEDIRLFRELR